jgi:hypothetical protein
MQKGGIASTERTSEDEARLVDERPDTLGADMM